MRRGRKKKIEHKLDLHGLRHHQVKEAVIRKIEDLWDSGVRLEIITGHSDKMKEIVRAVLSEYKLEPIESDFIQPGRIEAIIE